MPESPKLDVNSWLEDELYQQYKHDRQAVDASWKQMFENNGHTEPSSASVALLPEPGFAPQQPAVAAAGPSSKTTSAEAPLIPVAEGDQLVPLRGPALRIAENMTASLAIPLATS